MHTCIVHTSEHSSHESIGYNTKPSTDGVEWTIQNNCSDCTLHKVEGLRWYDFKTGNIFCLAENINQAFSLINTAVFLPEQ